MKYLPALLGLGGSTRYPASRLGVFVAYRHDRSYHRRLPGPPEVEFGVNPNDNRLFSSD